MKVSERKRQKNNKSSLLGGNLNHTPKTKKTCTDAIINLAKRKTKTCDHLVVGWKLSLKVHQYC